MKLFIAEKPSLARAIAEGIGIERREKTHLICRGGTVVTWCFGHLLELAEPDVYLGGDTVEAFAPEASANAFSEGYSGKKGRGKTRGSAASTRSGTGMKLRGKHKSSSRRPWRMEDLPILPDNWKVIPRSDSGAKAQLTAIRGLLKTASSVVNAGDPDREGQLLVDEVLEHCRCHLPVERFWASAIDPESVRRALRSLRPNTQYVGMRDAARGRSHADWLLGMNLTRLYTLREAAKGRRFLVVTGRVQTPTLTLVAQRDYAVRNFVPVPYMNILADCAEQKPHAATFSAKWKPEEGRKGLDAEGRLVDLEEGRRLVARLSEERTARVTASETTRKRERQPKCLSLADLQRAASKAHGFTAEHTLTVAQALYEKWKCASYPRTDCAYLPEAQWEDASRVLAAIGKSIPGAERICAKADPAIKSPTWNDKKVTAHHAIIPTGSPADWAKMSEDEHKVYILIAKRYIAQFLPVHELDETRLRIDIAGEPFEALGRVEVAIGWKILYRKQIEAAREKDRARAKEEGEPDVAQPVPRLSVGDTVDVRGVRGVETKTKPPAYYTEGTLIAAMESIHRAFSDPAVRARLKEADGIGTPATRAGIIAELRRRKLLVAEGKYLHCSPEGRELLLRVSPRMRSAVLTARFEEMLGEVEAGRMQLGDFEEQVRRFVRQEMTGTTEAQR